MYIIVHPEKGSYKVFFYDSKRVVEIGAVGLSKSSRGYRPKDFSIRSVGKRQLRHTPTKELIAKLRSSRVLMSSEDEPFASFLSDLQIGYGIVNLCRMCLYEDRISPVRKKNAVAYGKEKICMDCAKRELRRELGYVGHGFGSLSFTHLERLLELYRDLNRVLGMVEPERLDLKQTLFDTIQAQPVTQTTALKDLPLPPEFIKASRVERLMPVQQLCVEGGLLEGTDQLVVAATASGKTFIGEMAGANNYFMDKGCMLFLVPLVALANQKYSRFTERYGSIMNVGLRTGVSRLNLPETRVKANRNINSAIVVGTYEGIDHHIRQGNPLPKIGTVVIDEVQMLEDSDRGHRLDGLIMRLKVLVPDAQFLYLSATIGVPGLLAEKLNAKLIPYSERPVPLERHLIFTSRKQKVALIKRMVNTEFHHTSSKGYKGQTIVFTNARSRCHVIAEAIGSKAAPYHAGLTARERRSVEKRFEKGELAAVVTTAALAAGVDFPASQVIFDALAMGIKWLSVQEFCQMMGRAGRPDFHDVGRVVIIAEPGGSYCRTDSGTEEEIAIKLLQGEMEEVAPVYDEEQSSEEYVANAIVCKGDEKQLEMMCSTMVGEMMPVFPTLREFRLVKRMGGRVGLSPMAMVMAKHFIGVRRLQTIRKLVRKMDDPVEMVAEIDCMDDEEQG